MSLEEVEIRFLESGLKYEANGDVIAESIVSGYHSLFVLDEAREKTFLVGRKL